MFNGFGIEYFSKANNPETEQHWERERERNAHVSKPKKWNNLTNTQFKEVIVLCCSTTSSSESLLRSTNVYVPCVNWSNVFACWILLIMNLHVLYNTLYFRFSCFGCFFSLFFFDSVAVCCLLSTFAAFSYYFWKSHCVLNFSISYIIFMYFFFLTFISFFQISFANRLNFCFFSTFTCILFLFIFFT